MAVAGKENFRCPRTRDGTEDCFRRDIAPEIGAAFIASVNKAECLLDTLLYKDREHCPAYCPVKAAIRK